MAPIKFEEHLKDKLEKRTIQPSDGAWNALSDRLKSQNKKENNRTIWWFGIAASIVGIILITALIFDGSDSKNILPTVVDSENNEEVKANNLASETTEIREHKSIPEVQKVDTRITEEVTTNKKPNAAKAISMKGENDFEEVVALQEVKEQDNVVKSLAIPVNGSEFEQTKLNEVVAEITRLNTENQGVTEAEIDSLLKQAQRDILKNRIYNENTRTVDANALLQDVEAELDQSFRTRVFEALKNSYVTVKTAVAERNN